MSKTSQSAITVFQREVAAVLQEDQQLSGACTFLAENIKDIDFQIRQALGKQGIVAVVMTPSLSYRGKDSTTTWWDVIDAEVDITENPAVNRGKMSADDVSTAQDIACRVAQKLGDPGLSSPGQFCLKKIETSEWNGLLLSKVTFDAFICMPASSSGS